jgi:tetratricopeptide (TPR) repeat protein
MPPYTSESKVRAKLREAILAGFDSAALDQVLHDNNMVRHNVVTGRDFATYVNSLIEVSRQEGWLIELCRVLAAERIGNKAVSSAILTAQKWLVEQNDTNEIDQRSNFFGNCVSAFVGNAAFAADVHAGVLERRPLLFENVPPPDLNFTGRDRLVSELHQLLSDSESLPAVRIAAIHGLGGIGKTLLASEYAHLHSGAFRGVWWAPAQERSVLVASLAALAARFDERLANEPNLERAARTGLAHLAAQLGPPYLLIYDNVENPDELRDLLPIAGARVIVTTRWADWGGQAIEVKLDTLENAAAAAFLQKRAMRNDPGGAARLAAALGNLPLALDHAGAFCRLTQASFDSYEQRVETRIRRAPKGVNYPASVAATFGLAVDKVADESPAAEKLLGFCAFLASEGIPLDLIRSENTDEDEHAEAIMALAGTSLIEHLSLETQQPAITVHRLVQAAMRARLIERSEAERTLAQVMAKLEKAFPLVRFRLIDDVGRRSTLLPHVLAAHECFRSSGVQTSESAGRLFCATGRYLQVSGDNLGAERLFRDAIAVLERTFGPKHPDLVLALHDLAMLLLATGHYAETQRLIPRAIAIAETTIDDNDEDDAESVIRFNNLANLLTHVDRGADAEQYYRRAVVITEKLHGRDHPDIAGLLNNIANLLRRMTKYKDAEACYREAIAIATKTFGEHDPGVARYTHNLANLLRTKRRFDEAEPLYRSTIQNLSKALGEDYSITARARRNLAVLLLLTNRPNEALLEAQMALQGHDRGGDAVWIRDSVRTCAQALQRVGREAEGKALLTKFGLGGRPEGRSNSPAPTR